MQLVRQEIWRNFLFALFLIHKLLYNFMYVTKFASINCRMPQLNNFFFLIIFIDRFFTCWTIFIIMSAVKRSNNVNCLFLNTKKSSAKYRTETCLFNLNKSKIFYINKLSSFARHLLIHFSVAFLYNELVLYLHWMLII